MTSLFSEEDLTALREAVCKRQNEKRFYHTCGVEQEAAYIGGFLMPERVSELRAAGLLHDLTKCIPDEEQILLCEKLGIKLSDTDKKTPQTLHGVTAAEMIKKEFPYFATPSVLQSVRLHTTGSADMNMFDKIIFLSDYIEAGRPYTDCCEMRKKFHDACDNGDASPRLLDDIVCEVLLHTLEFLKKRQLLIAPATEEAYSALAGTDKEAPNGTRK